MGLALVPSVYLVQAVQKPDSSEYKHEPLDRSTRLMLGIIHENGGKILV